MGFSAWDGQLTRCRLVLFLERRLAKKMKWLKSNSACRNSTHLYNICNVLNKLKFSLIVKSNAYILNTFKNHQNKQTNQTQKSPYWKKTQKQKQPKNSGLQACHYWACHCYSHTGADGEGHTFWEIDHNAQIHQNPTKQKRLMKMLNFNNKHIKPDIGLRNIFPSNLSLFTATWIKLLTLLRKT